MVGRAHRQAVQEEARHFLRKIPGQVEALVTMGSERYVPLILFTASVPSSLDTHSWSARVTRWYTRQVAPADLLLPGRHGLSGWLVRDL